jgi:putative nucleotidyltransferase with HDIG domain
MSERSVGDTGFAILEQLWFSDFPDHDAEQIAANSLAATAGIVHGLRPFPEAATKLIDLTAAAEYNLVAIQEVVESDPSIASRLLQVVNSAAYGLRVRCTSLAHAVRLIGPKSIRELATALAVSQMYDHSDQRARELRDHGTIVGALSRYIADRNGLPSDDVYTCGLLHDLGKFLLLQAHEDEYGQILDSSDGVNTHHLAEREKYRFDHAVLGSHMLHAWRIPESVCQVIAWHHQPTRAYEAQGRIPVLVSLIRLADLLAYELRRETPDSADEALQQQICRTEAASFLGIDVEELASYWHDLHVVIREALAPWR